MNLPNKLTMLRILLIPVFMVFVEWDSLRDTSCGRSSSLWRHR